jgi:DNA topoisomerase VI subunit B
MTAHERPHLARALLDVERQLVEERQRRERAEQREQNLQSLITYMRDEAARITGVPHDQPSDVVETVRQLYDMAEQWKSEQQAALHRAGDGA